MRRWLLAISVVFLAILIGIDLVARSVAEGELAKRLRARVPAAGATSARIHSFPFVVRLLASGEVPEVDAEVRDVDVQGLRFASIAVELHGVRLDRQLLRNQRVVIERIDTGTVTAEVTQEALADAVGVGVTIEDGRATIQVAGQRISAEVAVRNGRLVVDGADLGRALPALSLVAPLLPCVPSARIDTGRVTLTCQFDEIPEELKQVA